MVRLFSPSPSKRLVRKLVDMPAIKREYLKHHKKLTYFGLPSEGFYDVTDWLSCIDRIVAVEKGDPYDPERKQSILLSKAIRLGLDERLTLLRGELNETILQGQDSIGQKLPYPFELVNFDYGGALLYPDRLRVEALDLFVRQQKGTDFLFLLTLNVREYDSPEIDATQKRMQTEISQLAALNTAEICSHFERINQNKSPLRQITYVLYLLKGLGEANHYLISWQPPILYSGSKKTLLIHYVIEFSYDPKASTKVVSDQCLTDILNVRPRVKSGNRFVPLRGRYFSSVPKSSRS